MQNISTPTRPAAPGPAPRVVETSRGTAHPDHERTRRLVAESLLLLGERRDDERTRP